MKTFTIDTENNITVHPSRTAARETGAGVFTTEEQFADLIGPDNKRLIEIWNSLPGVKAVTKFTSRKTATERIWRAIQSLGQASAAAAEEPAPVPEAAPAPEQEASEMAKPEAVVPSSPDPAPDTHVAPQSPDVAPEAAPAKTKTTRAKKTPVAATTKEAGAPREGSKTSKVIAMLRREGGTTLEEIMTAMGWLKHTTRAMLSAGGSLTKNHGLVITSEKVGDKRVYSIKG
jgi:hypothetical protein